MSLNTDSFKQANDLLDYFDSTVFEVSQAGDKLLEIINMLRKAHAAASADFAKQLQTILTDKEAADNRAKTAESELGRTRTELAQTRGELVSALNTIKDDAVAIAKAREAGEKARVEIERMVETNAKTVAELTAQRNQAIAEIEADRAEFDKEMEALLERLGKVYQMLSEENRDVINEANGGDGEKSETRN